jgi:ATPase subunit of ABC transporter with duplicated ATPase domains
MRLLELRCVTVTFATNPLFENLSLSVAKGERVALLGPNGCGKSTLLRLIAGEMTLPKGASLRAPETSAVAYLAQEAAEDLDDPLSGGERMYRQLAAALGRRPQLLLLDEPTNHLDERRLDWLERRLKAFSGAILFACHDQAFVAAVATRVLHLERGELRSYGGGFAGYLEARATEQTSAIRAHQSWQRQRDHVAHAAQRKRQWAEKAYRDAGERNPYEKKRAAKAMKQAIATERRLARLEQDKVAKPWQEPGLSFAFLPPSRLPPLVVSAQGVTYTYSGGSVPALELARLEIGRGERVGLIGVNGSGKTTLLNLIAASRQTETGSAAVGTMNGKLAVHPAAKILFFRQEGGVDPMRTPLRQLLDAGAPDASMARSLLGHFRLGADSALRPAKTLSPGERVRLGFCLALVGGPDLLLLDEPTNHLDLEGRQALAQALCAFPGAVLFVSHDRHFRTEVANRCLTLTPTVRPTADWV